MRIISYRCGACEGNKFVESATLQGNVYICTRCRRYITGEVMKDRIDQSKPIRVGSDKAN